uniref:Uncharacterized protein n=1 Tax=Molossus molossus TaxID=27622 RepID=A0A7J8IZ75_MOLMO|nr:hypothetical protein HJG59_010266 [Molossus molossus]
MCRLSLPSLSWDRTFLQPWEGKLTAGSCWEQSYETHAGGLACTGAAVLWRKRAPEVHLLKTPPAPAPAKAEPCRCRRNCSGPMAALLRPTRKCAVVNLNVFICQEPNPGLFLSLSLSPSHPPTHIVFCYE